MRISPLCCVTCRSLQRVPLGSADRGGNVSFNIVKIKNPRPVNPGDYLACTLFGRHRGGSGKGIQ
jgi:hypothetical protein